MRADKQLDALRREIDTIDSDIHDLLMKRTKIVEKVRDHKRGQKVKIRPAREAEILYRLTARHEGVFPKREITNIWREIIVATLSIEGPFSVAVYMPTEASGFWDVARDQYGSFTPMAGHTSLGSVINTVRTQEATVGVLPLPVRDDPDPWWPHLVTDAADAPKVIARLPFAGPANVREEGLEALVICPVPHEAAGRDRSLFVLEMNEEETLTQLGKNLAAFDLPVTFSASWRDAQVPGAWAYLVEVDGFAAADDARIARFVEGSNIPVTRVVALGGYATPLTAEELDGNEGGEGR